MARKKKRRSGMVGAAMDVAGGGLAFGIGTDIVGRVPHGQAGAAAMATGASMLPAYSTVRVGGVMIDEMRKITKKRKKKASLF